MLLRGIVFQRSGGGDSQARWERLQAVRKRAERLGLRPAGWSEGEPGKLNCWNVKQLARKARAPVLLVDPTDEEFERFAERAARSGGRVR